MAEKLNQGAPTFSVTFFDDLETQFIKKVRLFTIRVKHVLLFNDFDDVDLFDRAVSFFTQSFPDSTVFSFNGQSNVKNYKNLQREDDQLNWDLPEAESSFTTLQNIQPTEQVQDGQNEDHTGSTKHQVDQAPVTTLTSDRTPPTPRDAPLVSGPVPPPPPDVVSETEEKSDSAPSPSDKASQDAISASSLSGPPNSLRQRTSFSVRCPDDGGDPWIRDAKLLGDRLALVADADNHCVKLFTIQGKYLRSHKFDGWPARLTVFGAASSQSWSVGVTVPSDKTIVILEVTSKSITVMKSVQLSGRCWPIAVTNDQTVAVGYSWTAAGIDLVDLRGHVVRRLTTGGNLQSWYMETTHDGFLVLATMKDTLAKVKITDGTILYDKEVPNIKSPQGIAPLQGGYAVVSDSQARSLHLVTSEGHWDRELWCHPGGEDVKDGLISVCESNSVYLSCTKRGTIYVLDVS